MTEMYSIQLYVIKFVSDLWQVGSFLPVLRFPPPIKLTATIYIVTEILLKVALRPHKPNDSALYFMFSKIKVEVHEYLGTFCSYRLSLNSVNSVTPVITYFVAICLFLHVQ